MSHPYQCYREIVDQAGAWKAAVDTVLARKDALNAFWQRHTPNQVIFAGCTSPFYAGESNSLNWQKFLGIPARAVPSSELTQFPENYFSPGANPVLVVLSRSGRTTEAIWALEDFNKRYPGGRSLLITTRAGTPLQGLAGLTLVVPEGDDAALPQTRSLSTMYLTALATGALLGNCEAEMSILRSSTEAFPGIIKQVEIPIKEAVLAADFDKVFFLGGGPLFGIAQEATLKVMEMSFTSAFSFTFMESRHGPRSMLDTRSLVVGLFSHAATSFEAQVLQEYTQNFGVTSIALVPDHSTQLEGVSHVVSVDASWGDALQGLAYLPALQLLAYNVALKKAVNPDVSRNTTAFIEISRPSA